VQRAAGGFADGLAVKAPMPLTRRRQLPWRFLNVTSRGGGAGGDGAGGDGAGGDAGGGGAVWWNYIVDFGCNFQGGLNVSFGAPAWAAGRVVHVRTGETRRGRRSEFAVSFREPIVNLHTNENGLRLDDSTALV
jgi:hypothetical protein